MEAFWLNKSMFRGVTKNGESFCIKSPFNKNAWIWLPKNCYVKSNYKNYFGILIKRSQLYEERIYNEKNQILKVTQYLGNEILVQLQKNKSSDFWYKKNKTDMFEQFTNERIIKNKEKVTQGKIDDELSFDISLVS